MYECVATNSMGTKKAKINVVVQKRQVKVCNFSKHREG